jgi:hypothetical protein
VKGELTWKTLVLLDRKILKLFFRSKILRVDRIEVAQVRLKWRHLLNMGMKKSSSMKVGYF